MLRIQQIKLPVTHTEQELAGKIRKLLHVRPEELLRYRICRRSLDARKGELRYVYTIDAEVKQEGTVLKRCRGNAEKAKDVISENPTLPITLFQELQKDKNMCTDITVEDITYLMPELFKISFSDDIIQVLPGESVLGESGFAEYKLDVDSVKKMIIDTFYEEVE